jgi:hypothetical protein
VSGLLPQAVTHAASNAGHIAHRSRRIRDPQPGFRVISVVSTVFHERSSHRRPQRQDRDQEQKKKKKQRQEQQQERRQQQRQEQLQ